VGGQVAFRGYHLVDSPHNKLPQPHKGVWGEGGRIFVVRERGVIGGPVLDNQVPSAGPEGLVGFSDEIWPGNVPSRWGGGV